MATGRNLVRSMAAVLAVAMVVSGSVAAAQEQKPPVRVGGQVKAPTKIKDVRPIYPEEARAAGVAGVVILETAIGKDGAVIDVKVLRSVAGLDNAAIDAVRQWKYTPTLANGEPVEVLMAVTVKFTLKADAPAPGAPAPRLRVGRDVKEPRLIKHVVPVYPSIAQKAKIQGSVIIEAVIGTDGSVMDAKILRSVALLDAAAVDAVLQWKYTPTLVDGEPVEVLVVVTVNFTLK